MKNNKALIAIITFQPNIDDLRKVLDNLCNQAENVLIYDNASENADDIQQLANGYDKVRLFRNKENIGLPVNYNRAVKYAYKKSLEWVMLLDQDSCVPDDIVSTLLEYADDEKTAIVCPRYFDVNLYSDKEILGKDIVWPENIFFGEGASPEALALHTGIDSGYIQCLWRFGLFGTILLLLGYANMFFIAYKCGKSKSSRITIICIMFAFFLYLFKLYPIMNFGATILIFGIPTIIVCNYIKSNDGEKEHEPQKSITSGKRYNSNLQKV